MREVRARVNDTTEVHAVYSAKSGVVTTIYDIQPDGCKKKWMVMKFPEASEDDFEAIDLDALAEDIAAIEDDASP